MERQGREGVVSGDLQRIEAYSPNANIGLTITSLPLHSSSRSPGNHVHRRSTFHDPACTPPGVGGAGSRSVPHASVSAQVPEEGQAYEEDEVRCLLNGFDAKLHLWASGV